MKNSWILRRISCSWLPPPATRLSSGGGTGCSSPGKMHKHVPPLVMHKSYPPPDFPLTHCSRLSGRCGASGQLVQAQSTFSVSRCVSGWSWGRPPRKAQGCTVVSAGSWELCCRASWAPHASLHGEEGGPSQGQLPFPAEPVPSSRAHTLQGHRNHMPRDSLPVF